MTTTAKGSATMMLQAQVNQFSRDYQAKYGYSWRYEGATVRRDGRVYFLVTPEGVHYFLSTRVTAMAHLRSYLATGRGNDAMRRAGVQ